MTLVPLNSNKDRQGETLATRVSRVPLVETILQGIGKEIKSWQDAISEVRGEIQTGEGVMEAKGIINKSPERT